MTVATIEEAAIDLPLKDLTLQDRCDACSARALFHAVHSITHHDLMFCKHHGDKYVVPLSVQGFVISNQTAKLEE